MKRNTKANILAPPNVGVLLLEMFLPPTVAENEIGDLDEEYSAKVKQDGLARARRWFWIQVFYTLGASLREEGARCLLHRGAVHWYRGRDGSLQASFDISQLGRNRVVALLTIVLILCVMLVYSPRPRTGSPVRELAQMRSMLETGESPQLDHTSTESNFGTMRQMTPAAGRAQLKVSKKTIRTETSLATTVASQNNEEQTSHLPVPPRSDTVVTEDRTSWVQSEDTTQHTAISAVGENAQAGEGVQLKEQNSTTTRDSIKTAGPETPRSINVAAYRRERDYFIPDKPAQQTQRQDVPVRGCFF